MTVMNRAERILSRLAREDFGIFLELVGVDDDGRPLAFRPVDRLVWDFVAECHALSIPACAMLPMGFGKTTQFCYRAAWEIGRDPNVLISVVTDSLDNSKERVELIRRIIDLENYRRVFPKVRVLTGKDERQRFTVDRTGLSKDSTCTAEGVLTGTGTRTNFLMMDDVVTLRNAILEPLNRRRVIDAIRTTWMSRSKIHSDKSVRVAMIQTAYHMADAAAVFREDPKSGWRFLVVRAEEPYEHLAWEKWIRGEIAETGAVQCPFPRTAVAARAQQMGPTAAARGLGNRPVSGEECPFKDEHFDGPVPIDLRYYRDRILFADPAGDATKLKTGDPDWCACVAIGRLPDGTWDVILAERMRGSPSEQASFIARKAVQVRANAVWQEAVKDETMVAVTQQVLLRLAYPVTVQPEKPNTNKEIRIIQTLEPPLASSPQVLRVCGRLFPELKSEALTFPAGAHDDLIDALAGAFSKAMHGPSFWDGFDATDRDADERRERDAEDRRKILDSVTPSSIGFAQIVPLPERPASRWDMLG